MQVYTYELNLKEHIPVDRAHELSGAIDALVTAVNKLDQKNSRQFMMKPISVRIADFCKTEEIAVNPAVKKHNKSFLKTGKAMHEAIAHMAGTGQCEMCGGDGKEISYHEECACKRIRQALEFIENGKTF